MDRAHQIEILYEPFRRLIVQLQAEDFPMTAARTRDLLELPWTTSSELLGELGREIRAFENDAPSVSPRLQTCLQDAMSSVRVAWPEFK